MAVSLNKTKRRISSVNATKKLTKAMGLIATVKLKKFKNVMLNNAPFSDGINETFAMLTSSSENETLLKLSNEGKGAKILLVVITSNLGLCASFNNDIFKYVASKYAHTNIDILTIGSKGFKKFSKEDYTVIDQFTSLNERLNYQDSVNLSDFLYKQFINGSYKTINILYTKYLNSIKFVPEEITYLPVSLKEKKKTLLLPLFDTSEEEMLIELLPIYLSSTLYSKLVESQVSEQAARRNAMDNANDNADEILDKLTLEYNKARQAAITSELSDVVSSTLVNK